MRLKEGRGRCVRGVVFREDFGASWKGMSMMYGFSGFSIVVFDIISILKKLFGGD